jgi:hypothetical protein
MLPRASSLQGWAHSSTYSDQKRRTRDEQTNDDSPVQAAMVVHFAVAPRVRRAIPCRPVAKVCEREEAGNGHAKGAVQCCGQGL